MRSVKHLNMNVRHNDRMNENERVEGMMDEFLENEELLRFPIMTVLSLDSIKL